MRVLQKLIYGLIVSKMQTVGFDVQISVFDHLDDVCLNEVHGDRYGIVEERVYHVVQDVFFAFEVVVD